MKRSVPLSGRRISRSMRPAGLAGAAAARWATTYLFWGERRQRRREAVVLRTAQDVTRTLGEMKGAVMKVGQVLSLMTGVVPEEMSSQLATLHANAPPMAFNLVEQVFIEDHGAPPRALFRRFDHEPFAAASIGQVHRATTRDGRHVAVKVQYPGVRQAIDADLANVGFVLSLAGVVSSGLDVGPIVRDISDGIRAELDYLREAEWQRRFGQLYQGHAFVRVPDVLPELTTSRILVQEFIHGRPFSAAASLPAAERDRVAEIVFRFAFGNFYRHRLFNGDPHPGNYLLLDDGRVAFLDYGCIAQFEPSMVDALKAVLFALYDQDLDRWRAATEAVGILRPNAPFTTGELYEHMHWFWEPILHDEVTFTPDLAAEMVRRNTQSTGHGGQVNRQLNIPPGTVFLTRINFGLSGLLANLRAHGSWRGIISEYLYDSPPTTELGRRSAATTAGPSI